MPLFSTCCIVVSPMLPLVKRSVVLSVSSGSSFVEAEGQDGGEEESRLRRERRSIGLAKCLRALSSRLLVFLSVWPPVSPVVLLSGEHELEQGLSLSSSLISAHHLHPERFMKRIKRSREEERERERTDRGGAKIDANSVASECQGEEIVATSIHGSWMRGNMSSRIDIDELKKELIFEKLTR